MWKHVGGSYATPGVAWTSHTAHWIDECAARARLCRTIFLPAQQFSEGSHTQQSSTHIYLQVWVESEGNYAQTRALFSRMQHPVSPPAPLLEPVARGSSWDILCPLEKWKLSLWQEPSGATSYSSLTLWATFVEKTWSQIKMHTQGLLTFRKVPRTPSGGFNLLSNGLCLPTTSSFNSWTWTSAFQIQQSCFQFLQPRS